MMGFTCWPKGVPRATWSRRRSPVESFLKPSSSASLAAWVPLPAPGGPKKITASPIFPP